MNSIKPEGMTHHTQQKINLALMVRNFLVFWQCCLCWLLWNCTC